MKVLVFWIEIFDISHKTIVSTFINTKHKAPSKFLPIVQLVM